MVKNLLDVYTGTKQDTDRDVILVKEYKFLEH